MAADPHDSDTSTPRPILTRGQCVEIALLPTFTGLLMFVMLSIKFDYVKSLWETPLGIKMMVSGMLLMFVGIAVTTLLYIIRNRVALEAGSGKAVLLTIGFGLTFLFFFMPAIFVILIGPAAIQIVEGFK